MVSSRDAYDDWFDGDDRYEDVGDGWDRHSSRPLELVRPTRLAFEVVAPETFEVAQDIADRLRTGDPVLIDLQACDRDLAGRLTDFCSGLVYALDGGLQYVGTNVLLVTPSRVAVSGDEASAVRRPGFYNRS